MLKSEINFNVDKADQIKKEAKKNLLPNYRFKIDIKNACWTKIVEYWHKDRELINEISLLYFKYELLNRTIDTGLQRINSKLPITGLFAEVDRICKKIEEKSKETLKKF